MGDGCFVSNPVGSIALIGETYADAREVMVEGPSGLLNIHPQGDRPTWISSRRRLEWPNGAVAQVFSSEDPDGLRGPQFEAAWCDELAKWKHQRQTWDMLQFGLRLGEHPRQVITTTPRPGTLLKEIMESKRTIITRMKTDDNRLNLAQGFLDGIVENYRGTRLGRQELDGEILVDRPDALWQVGSIPRNLDVRPEDLARIVVAVDPPVTGNSRSNACGIVVAGIDENKLAHVLADETLEAVSPAKWSARVSELYHRFGADKVVIETNQGGDMAESVLRMQDPDMAIKQVKATRGKRIRAEPVAHLYERGSVSHAGHFARLEDEMYEFGLDGLPDGRSPDRMDALVWALTELLLNNKRSPRARTL